MASICVILLWQRDHQYCSSSQPAMTFQPPIKDSDVVDGLNVRYLKIFGLWRVINDYRTTGKKNAVIKSIMIITIIYSLPYMICQCLSYFMIKVDIQKATFLNLHTLPGIQLFCKILVFWFRMESQCRLYNLIRKDFLRNIPECRREETENIYKKVTKNCNKTCIAAFIVNASIVIVTIADPEISIDYLAHHTGSMAAMAGGKKKILSVWYPFPMSESPYYEAIFIYETMFIIMGGILLAAYICLFYQVLMCLYAQYLVLGHHMSNLKFSTVKSCKRSCTINDQRGDSEMYKELCAILQEHKKLLSYSDELRSVYNPFVTMILGVGILILIIAVFQFLFGGTRSPIFIARSLQFLAYQGIEFYMFCFGSSYIQEASSNLQFAIYSSDWYRADTKFRKAALMVMLRARKGETLTAIRMYPINRETIMAILQFTYSMAAFMSRSAE